MDVHRLTGTGDELHAPGQGGLAAECLTVHEVAPAAHGLTDEQTHNDQVGERAQLEAAAAAEDIAGGDGHDDTAVDGQSAVPNGDDPAPVQRTVSVFELGQVEDDVVDPCADDGQGHAPQHAVQQVILADAVLRPLAHTEPQGQHHAQGDEDAVPVDGLAADVEGHGGRGKLPVAE